MPFTHTPAPPRPAFFATLWVAVLAQAAWANGPPNIVFLLTDDQRYDTLGANGNDLIRTPHLDQLATESVSFDHAYVTTSICMTSRASIMTGQYAARHGINRFGIELTESQMRETYFAQLRGAGYRVGFVGKWGVGSPPQDGLDFNRGFAGQGRYYDPGAPSRPHMTRWLGDQAVEFLEAVDDQRPFCLSVSFKAPHVQDGVPRPFRHDRELSHLYANVNIPSAPLTAPRHFDALPEFLRATENRVRWKRRFATPELYQESVKGYYRLISGVDVAVGRIRDQLQRTNLADNTILIFTSDHGFFLGERGWAGKWFAHDASIHVPLVIHDPRLRQSEPDRRREIVLNIDIAPTILEYAGLPVPAGMQGRSLRGLVERRHPTDWRTDFFYEHHFAHQRIPRSEGVRTRDWKYIRYLDAEPVYEELYDLGSDPQEAFNLAAAANAEDQLDLMRKRWQELRAAVR